MPRGPVRRGFRVDDPPRWLGGSEDSNVNTRRLACGIEQIVLVVGKKLRRPMIVSVCCWPPNGARFTAVGRDAEQRATGGSVVEDRAVAIPGTRQCATRSHQPHRTALDVDAFELVTGGEPNRLTVGRPEREPRVFG